MEIKKDKKTGMFSLEGMTEGKLLCLKRILHKEFVTKGSHGTITADLYLAVERGVNANVPFGTEEG